MTNTPKDGFSGRDVISQAPAALRFMLKLPFRIAARLVQHAVQILFALFVLFLHPQLKWLFRLIAESAIVRIYLASALRVLSVYFYEPYFAFLRRLPPYWAAFSVALPLAVLEPAKLGATIMIAQRPKSGAVLWFALQGVSLLLIDRTWVAVRPQSRKIRLVARIHAWLWLNAEHGKYWIKNSRFYRMITIWARKTRRSVRGFWLYLKGVLR